jgi:hypothetical protein
MQIGEPIKTLKVAQNLQSVQPWRLNKSRGYLPWISAAILTAEPTAIPNHRVEGTRAFGTLFWTYNPQNHKGRIWEHGCRTVVLSDAGLALSDTSASISKKEVIFSWRFQHLVAIL